MLWLVMMYIEEYDRQLAEALSKGLTVDHSLALQIWTKVAGDKTKGKLYGAGNLTANYRKGVATTLRFTLNHGEGSSQQPALTPEMHDLIQRLTQEQLTQQMARHEAVVQDLLSRQRTYEEQLAQFRQAHEDGNSSQQASVPDPNVEPFPIYGEGGSEGSKEIESDDEE
ncbi:hypothetical protein MTR_3g058800 [Medicago truncatula]|uniref:Uncharacterized protein n=1 Tax=Medicago truncatula TaxID=3880 RepID=A0A072V7B4_MEDTR|nr:hypothetical protein MTR_3g058800 [Medicago truncatula]